MGGSAISGDLISSVLAQSMTLPFHVVRGYDCPAWVGAESLVVAVSYSGQTEETLSVFHQAVARNATLVAITSGGTLAQEAAHRGLPLVTIPKGLPPRSALGYLLLPLLRILERAGVGGVPDRAIEEALALLDRELDAVGPSTPAERNPSKQLAQAVEGKTAIVYGTSHLTDSVAYRWKTQIEENAKAFAVSGSIPECDHNEVVGWHGDPLTSRFHAVFLRDRAESRQIAKRMEVTREIAALRAGTTEVWSKGEGRLARILNLVQVGDWASYYLAMLRGVDPWPVTVIDQMKQRLAGC
jgi:glucose/mannose-6-phosphate isomerase